MKPFIGIIPLIDTQKESYWMLPGYMKAVEQAGGIPIMLPLTDDGHDIKDIIQRCQGFLLTGGHDISPELYGEKKSSKCGECILSRDRMEQLLLIEALKEDKAILGICRGIQMLNVVLGGTLYQDIPTQMKTELQHHQTPPYHQPVHQVILEKDTPLSTLLEKEDLQVNSYHHQGIKNLSSHLHVMAKAKDGLIEAVYAPRYRFVWAVQWHPEFLFENDVDSQKIWREFVKAARIELIV